MILLFKNSLFSFAFFPLLFFLRYIFFFFPALFCLIVFLYSQFGFCPFYWLPDKLVFFLDEVFPKVSNLFCFVEKSGCDLLPLSVTGTVRIWHANTYRLESTLNYGLERAWTIACQKGSNNVAVGYDEGSIIIKVSYILSRPPAPELADFHKIPHRL